MFLLRKRVLSVLVIGLLWLGFSVPAVAAILHGDFFGTNIAFLGVTEDSTSDPGKELYGGPTVFGGQALYFPTNFTSQSSDGSSDTTSGALTMTLQASPGFAIDTVSITEWGNYALDGISGTSDTWASIGGTLEAGSQSSSLLFNPGGSFEFPGDTSGSYTGGALLDFSGLGITQLSFSLSNVLQTQSEVGTTSYIAKNVASQSVGIVIDTTPIPIPGAVWLFGSGLITLWGVRLRFTKQDNLAD